MKTVLVLFLNLCFLVAVARAQEDPVQQQIDQINGQIQDIEAAQAAQEKRIEALEGEVNNLASQLNQNNTQQFASQSDLQQLAGQVQEIDRKRQDDNQRILNQLTQLEQSLNTPGPTYRPPVATATVAGNNPNPNASGTQTGYNYNIQSGDTISAIARAYRHQGVKVSVEQILGANPGLNPNDLQVGRKIFIPAPTQ